MKTITEGLEFLYKLVENFPDGIIVFDLEGKLTLLNRVALKQFNAQGSLSEYLEQPVLNLIGNNSLGQKVRSCITEGRSNFQFKAMKINNTHLDVYGKKISEGMLLFVYDVTKNIKAKNLTLKNLIKGQELERQRIAKEIHDGVGPSLSTIRLGIDTISAKSNEDVIKSKLELLSSQITEIAQDIRSISHDLMPSSLLDFGIKSALENLIKNIESNTSINIDNQIEIEDDNELINYNQSLNIYRITQEAIHNGIKHGNANHFLVSIEEKNGSFQLKIIDNGEKNGNVKVEGIGLKNMRARVSSMNGSLTTNFLKPNGFEVKALIPFKKSK